MPPKKKKNKNSHNEFYFFMQDQKKVLQLENVYWNSMEELVDICHPRWKNLSDVDKARYKDIAKAAKQAARESLDDKFDSRGRSLASVEQEQRNREKDLVLMTKRIKSIIDVAKELGNLTNQKFFLIHINKLCQVDEEKFLPCELALLQFNLQDGILHTFHTFVAPPADEIPLGFGYEIQKNADDTHGLTMDDDPMLHEKSSGYSEIARKIMANINPGGINEAIWPIFTLEDDEEMVKFVLDDLFAWAGERKPQEFKVYHVHLLLYYLSQLLPPPDRIKSEVLSADQIASDIYSYTVGMGCPYHDKIDKPRFCSLNCVKRWAYLIMDQCCPPLKIEQAAETHYHVERPFYLQRESKFKQEFHVEWTPVAGDDGTITSAEVDRDIFGAPKTRAAPAGFVAVRDEENIPNPKKMSTREREALEKKLAAQGRSLEEWTGVKNSLPEKEPFCPWDNDDGVSPISNTPLVNVPAEPPCPWAKKPVDAKKSRNSSPWVEEPKPPCWGPTSSSTVVTVASEDDFPSLGMKSKRK